MTGPPRSVLYVPASHERHLEKIPALGADAILVDLEDGVAAQDKDAAREHVRAACARGILAGRRWMLRVNAGPMGPPAPDLTLVGFAQPPTVVLPKADDPARVRQLATRFAEHGSATALMIESAQGLARVHELAGAHPGIGMLILGSADLRWSLRARPDAGRNWESHALAQVLLAARVHGAAAIDSVYFHYRDAEGLRRHAAIARDLGYDGKSCIHPSQIDVIHEVYRSTPEEVRWARRVLETWSLANGAARGVITVDGEMIEALHVEVARRILGDDAT